MKSILKNVLLLCLLFGLGTVMLGVFNPGVTVEGEDSTFSSVGQSWDVFIDTTHHDLWRSPESSIEWKAGRKVEQNATWTLTEADGRLLKCKVTEMIKDSSMTILMDGEAVSNKQTTTFRLKNGKTLIKVNEKWEAKGFWENIGLNFDRGTYEKDIENRLKSAKAILEPKED